MSHSDITKNPPRVFALIFMVLDQIFRHKILKDLRNAYLWV